MQSSKKNRENVITNMFFTLKVLALLFCAGPIFQHYFEDSAGNAWGIMNIQGMLVFFIILVIILFMWFLLNYRFKTFRLGTYIEITLLYAMCLSSVLYSGYYQSYYKFIFVFIIVAYTMDLGMRVGLIVSGLSSVSILCMDLFMYRTPGVNAYFESDLALSAMFFVVAWILGSYVRTDNEHIQELKNFANMDGLTQLYNHRYFYDEITHLFNLDPKCQDSLSLIMLDIDYFKSYNDLYGHQKGDDVLREISDILRSCVRPGDVVCRYGGEEFAIIYPHCTKAAAMELADRLRKTICDYAFYGQELMPDKNLTVSIGLADRNGTEDTVKNLIGRADSALYRAKFFRKNRVEQYSSVFDQFTHLDLNSDESMVSVKSLITIINSRDRYTYNHTERVVNYCDIFAKELGLDSEDRIKLIYSAYLHDIGKINIPQEVLTSERRLSDEQWEKMKKHPSDGADIVRQLHDLDEIAEIVEQHHERYDGNGYPKGLKGESIHPLARVLTLADSFDAMTSKRPYQSTRRYESAFEELRKCAGTQFDPALVEQFIKAIDEHL